MVVGFGKDSHAFDFSDMEKKLVLGGVVVENHTPLKGNSDADVILHAITNAISSVTGINILGAIADKMCLIDKITDSSEYLKEAKKYLDNKQIKHIAISLECKTPKITPLIPQIKKSISNILEMPQEAIGITATSGEDLTPFGKGLGIECEVVITID